MRNVFSNCGSNEFDIFIGVALITHITHVRNVRKKNICNKET